MSIEKLYIFEKPDAGKNFVKALRWNQATKGKGFIQQGNICVTWCIGHLLQQAPPTYYEPEIQKSWDIQKLPIIPEKWEMVYNDKDLGRKGQLFTIRDLLKKSKSVVIATDDDREGETIGWEVIEFFNYSGKKFRMIYGDLTAKTLLKANENLQDGEKYRSRYMAGLGRMRADWIMGFNCTMGYTTRNQKKLPPKEVINAGRVISPLAFLLSERRKERENFKPEDHFTFKGKFSFNSNDYEGDFIIPEELKENGILKNKEKIKEIEKQLLSEKTATILEFKVENKKERQPLGFSLSELQKIASKKLNFSPKETLDVAQSLYEKHHLISYPRTDCKYVNEGQYNERKEVINTIYQNFGSTTDVFIQVKKSIDLNIKTAIWDDKKISAHHAIIPTDEKKSASSLSSDEKNLYEIICKRYVAQFLPEHQYQSTTIITETNDFKHQFDTKGRIIINNGWKDIEKEKSNNKEVPQLKKGVQVNIKNIEKIAKKTEPPKHYNYDSLLSDMNNIDKFIKNPKLKKIIKGKGIGTEATRADHIDGLFQKGFAKKEKKNIIATDKCMDVVDILPDENKQPEISAYWEEELDLIEKGSTTLDKFLQKQASIIQRIINKINEGECDLKNNIKGKGKTYTCDKCESIVSKFKSKNGNTLWRCLNQDCDGLYKDDRGKRGEIINFIKQPEGDFPCPTCSKQMLRRKKKNEDTYFWVCSDQSCKTFCKDDNGKLGEVNKPKAKPTSEHKCPKCDKGRLIQRSGNNGKFWGCNNYPECKTTVQDKNDLPDYENYGKKTEKPKSDHKCPNCNKGYLVKRKKKSDGGIFWGCNNYPECKTIKNDKDGKPED